MGYIYKDSLEDVVDALQTYGYDVLSVIEEGDAYYVIVNGRDVHYLLDDLFPNFESIPTGYVDGDGVEYKITEY